MGGTGVGHRSAKPGLPSKTFASCPELECLPVSFGKVCGSRVCWAEMYKLHPWVLGSQAQVHGFLLGEVDGAGSGPGMCNWPEKAGQTCGAFSGRSRHNQIRWAVWALSGESQSHHRYVYWVAWWDLGSPSVSGRTATWLLSTLVWYVWS